jgi:hypothetical protein
MAYLFSKEDKNRTHAIFGFSSLLNFIIQYYHIWNYGKMTNYQYLLIPMHILLSLTSLKFHLPNKRNEKVVVISPTIRLHTIIFSCRGFICYLIHVYIPSYNILLASTICYITIYLSDITIDYYKLDYKSEKTMRDIPNHYFSKFRYKYLHWFYSGIQFAATVSCIKSAETAYATTFPIQLAAFLQTLIRKGKMNSKLWHPLYAISLTMALYVNTQFYFDNIEEGFIFTSVGFISWIMRVHLNISKYIVWLIAIFIINTKDCYIEYITPYNNQINQYIYPLFIAKGIVGTLLSIPL